MLTEEMLQEIREKILWIFHTETGAVLLSAAQTKTAVYLDSIEGDLDLNYEAVAGDGRTLHVTFKRVNGKVEKATIAFSLI